MQETSPEASNTPPYKLFIAGLPPLTTKADIVEAIQKQYKNVPVYNVKVPRKYKLGFAYLEINTIEGFNTLITSKYLHVNNRDVVIKLFEKGQELGKFKDDIQHRRLFVYSLPPSITNEDLYKLFSPYGSVEDAYIIKDRSNGTPKGFGYVVYDTKEDTDKVLKIKSLKFKQKKIWIKLHEKPLNSEKFKQMQDDQYNNANSTADSTNQNGTPEFQDPGIKL
jgi:RNA recognition motif-containing protein